VKRLALALTLAALLAGCGARSPVEGRVPGRTLRIYMSGSLSGASATSTRAAMRGAEMALRDHGPRIGRYRIQLTTLDDATAQSDGWDPNQTTLNARTAAQDPTAIGYIGEFDSGASAISIPILNRAGVPQVSAQGGAVGLTSDGPGRSPGEPAKYYPTGRRTFVRVVPTYAVEAAVEVSLEQTTGCRSAFVLQDGRVDGEDAAISFVLAAQAAGLRVLGVQSYEAQAGDYRSVGLAVAKLAPSCVLLAATDEHSAARVAAQVGAVDPSASILAASPLADPAFVDPELGGIPLSLDPRVFVLAPGLASSSYPRRGQEFLARYARLYGSAPPQAIFGYEAMSLLLHAINVATDHGRAQAVRARVVQELFATRERHSLLGTYSLDRDGDTSLRAYGIYRVKAGALSFVAQERG